VTEIETESLSTWESQRHNFYRGVEFQAWFNQMTTSGEAGNHEFLRIKYTSG
jgi:hypothetical protein